MPEIIDERSYSEIDPFGGESVANILLMNDQSMEINFRGIMARIRPNGEIDWVKFGNSITTVSYDYEKGTATVSKDPVMIGSGATYPISAINDREISPINWAAYQYRHNAPEKFSAPLREADITYYPKTVGYLFKNESQRENITKLPTVFSATINREFSYVPYLDGSKQEVTARLRIHENGVMVELHRSNTGYEDHAINDLYLFDNDGIMRSKVRTNYNGDVLEDITYFPRQTIDGGIPIISNYAVTNIGTQFSGLKHPKAGRGVRVLPDEQLSMRCYNWLIKLIPPKEREHVADEAIDYIASLSKGPIGEGFDPVEASSRTTRRA